MNRITHRLPVKIVAIFVLVALVITVVGSLGGVYFAYEAGMYDQNHSFYETESCRDQTENYAWEIVNQFRDSYTADELSSFYTSENSNLSFVLSKAAEPDVILARNDARGQPGYTNEYLLEEYKIICTVNDPILARDSYYLPYRLFNFIYPLRYALIVALLSGVLLFFVVLIFLLCSAGHRVGTDEIVLNHQDKIPLDLYLTASLLTILFILSVTFNDMGYFSAFRIVVLCLPVLLAFLIALAALLTVATRIKAGRWWQNTLIYRVLKFIRRIWHFFIRALSLAYQNMSLVWKTTVIFCGASLINFILSTYLWNSWNKAAGLFMLFVFNIFLLAAVCLLSVNLNNLKKAGQRIAAGDLDYQVDTSRMYWEFKQHGENLNSIVDSMALAVDQRMKSERLKTELITNVSHDIKTPLTSIINYVDLLKKDHTAEQAAEYIAILDRQAKRLKKLTEDVVEASKVSTGNLPVTLVRTSVGEIINQAFGEYEQRLLESKLETVVTLPQDELFIAADGRLLWRVLDNLLSNACKYAQAGTRVYLDAKKENDQVVISLKNVSRDKLNVDADELMERFVRGDIARNSEGSGLGLNIARSLIELQKGTFAIAIDCDLFKVTISFAAN